MIDLRNQGGETGRADFQSGWHEFYQNTFIGTASGYKTLDIGSGLGLIKDRVLNVVTSDNYPGCNAYVDFIGEIDDFGIKSYDFVTMFDVIEHIENDIEQLKLCSNVARKGIFLTTPNFDHSRCQNPFHCREYTSDQLEILCEQVPHKKIDYFSGDPNGRCIEWTLQSMNEHLGAMIWLS